MKRELSQFVDKYLKAINNETAAVFAGAGLSVATGMVDWKNLLREAAIELNLDVDKETDLISLTQYYETAKGGRGCINAKLIDEFTKDVSESENHEILSSLPIRTFWTTNYDKLIEKSLEGHGKIVDVKICSENLAINKPQRDVIVYKMHGDISLSHEAVITKDDYERYNEKRQLFTTSLQGDLVSKTFLFIGFSFEDPNLEYILSRIRILLGNHVPEHFCFFKNLKVDDYITTEEYVYAKTKQDYKIRDLKRFGIQALLIDEYEEITEVLRLINVRLKRKNVFISGAAYEYGRFSKEEAEKLIYDISMTLAIKEYKIISGFGLGIGSSVVNGVLSHIYSKLNGHLDDYLLLRPFPQNIIDEKEREALWKKYRYSMLSEAGIAVFFFGNKLKDKDVVDSDGLIKEFDIAVELGVKVIPIGCTGYVSKKLWTKVMASYNDYYPNQHELKETIELLGDDNLSEIDIKNNIIKAINLLQNHI